MGGWGEPTGPTERLGIGQLEDRVARLERTLADRDDTIGRLRAEVEQAHAERDAANTQAARLSRNLHELAGGHAAPQPASVDPCGCYDLPSEAQQ